MTDNDREVLLQQMSQILDHDDAFYDTIDSKKYWKNVNQIFDFLFLGDQFAAKRKELLEENKISHVINLSGSECPFSKEFEYLEIEAEDHSQYPILSHFPQVFDFIEKARTDDENRVLIHCMAGSNRSGALYVAYCMAHMGWSTLEATQWVFDRRPIILTNLSFREQLVSFNPKTGEDEKSSP